MVRNILVGLDGSPYSETAVEQGIRLGRRFGALLTGLGVIDEPTILKPEPVPLGAGAYKAHRDATLLDEARQKVGQFLKRFAERCDAAGVARKELTKAGLPEEVIPFVAQGFDLIVLGQRTYFHFETQDEPGDTLTELLKGCPRPVLTAPERPCAGDRVVVAYDGSLQAARALQVFQQLGLADEREVHLVGVDDKEGEAARRLEPAADFLSAHGIATQPHALTTGETPAAIILDLVRKVDAGLLVMGAFGRSAFKEFFLGSVTRTVLEESNVPLFLYH